MITENFIKFLKYFGKGKTKSIINYIILTFITGGFEFLGVALVYPFILLLLKPDASFINKIPFECSPYLIGLMAIALFLIKNIFMIWQIKIQTKFVQNWNYELKALFMEYFLYSDYKTSSSTSASDKLYIINFLIPTSLSNFVLRIMNLFVNAVIVAAILGLLFWKFTVSAVIATIFSIATVVFQHLYFKNKSKILSAKIAEQTKIFLQKLQDIVYNIKQVKISCLETKFLTDFNDKQKELNDLNLESGFISGIPPYIIETLIILTLVLLLGIMAILNKNNSEILVASYAVMVAAIFRIAPALNRVQSSLNGMNLSRQHVKRLINYYEKFNLNNMTFDTYRDCIKFEKNIRLENVTFAYNDKPVIKNLSAEIKKGEFIGIVGLSGAGKSTLADILMGLYPIQEGKIYLDNEEISDLSSLRRLIGYVPQKTVLLGKTFLENIYWGSSEYDTEKVKDSLKKAQMYDFITENYKDGLNASPVVNGEGLSLGQMQRLSIARALYKNPQLLILDEATSSLDVQTENEITQTLNTLKGSLTIISIAHRLSTLKSCDRLFFMTDGQIKDTGTFSELYDRNPDFAKLVDLSELNIEKEN
ncbi:ABC transporter ATP-binding protein [bacterium]|nr:ABC transporter ATP-binding protein [bacterium]